MTTLDNNNQIIDKSSFFDELYLLSYKLAAFTIDIDDTNNNVSNCFLAADLASFNYLFILVCEYLKILRAKRDKISFITLRKLRKYHEQCSRMYELLQKTSDHHQITLIISNYQFLLKDYMRAVLTIDSELNGGQCTIVPGLDIQGTVKAATDLQDNLQNLIQTLQTPTPTPTPTPNTNFSSIMILVGVLIVILVLIEHLNA